MNRPLVFSRNHLLIFICCITAIILIITTAAYILPKVKIKLMSPYELSSFLADYIWTVLTAIGTIAAAWGAYYAANVSLKIADKSEQSRQREEIKQKEHDLLISRFFILSINSKLKSIRTALDILNNSLNDSNNEIENISKKREEAFRDLLDKVADFPSWTPEHLFLLKQLPNYLGIRLCINLSLLEGLMIAKDCVLDNELISKIKEFTHQAKNEFDIVYPALIEEMKKMEDDEIILES